MRIEVFQKLASATAQLAGILGGLAPAMNSTARAAAVERLKQTESVLRSANTEIGAIVKDPEEWQPLSTLPRWDGAVADLWVFSEATHTHKRIPDARHKDGDWVCFVGNDWGWDEPIESRHKIIAWKPVPKGPKGQE